MTFKPEILYGWESYGQKAVNKILSPRCVGTFTDEEARNQELTLIKEHKGHVLVGNMIHIYWLIDSETGFIVDAKFQAFGNPALIAIGETACEMMIGKEYTNAYNVSFETIDLNLKDSSGVSLPSSCIMYFGLIIDVLDGLAESCTMIPGIPLSSFVSREEDNPDLESLLPPLNKEDWEGLSDDDKKQRILVALEACIIPYIRMDGGDISVLNVIHNTVTIAYQGACTGCYSAVGSTLNSIIEILKSYVYSDIEVQVEENSLFFKPSDA
ncbi:MAG: iron-sulfur cluster assembly scaffold protein [Victivallaceae bacterium]